MYRSLMRIYLIFATMTVRERIKRFNVFSLTLKSHDNYFSNVISAMKAFLTILDKELKMQINNIEKIVCAYTLAYIDDIS